MRTPDVLTAKLAEREPFAVEQAPTQSKQAAENGLVQIREAREHGECNQTIKRLGGVPDVSTDGILARPRNSRHNPFVMTEERPIRVLIAKPGLDGHDRGAKVVARALRDAGMEVIYTGIRQTPEMIAEAALQEDVQVVGLSILSGAHAELFPRVVAALKERGINADEILLFAGGIIPDDDIPALKELGFQEIFRPGASTQDIIKFVRDWSAKQRGDGAKGEAAGEP